MIGAIITSRLAGPVASGVALVAILFGVGQCTARQSAERRVDKVQAASMHVQRSWDQCRANVDTLKGSLAAQNAQLAARSAEDAQRLAEATKQLSEAVKGRGSAEARAAALLKRGPVGIDACARAMNAFETVKEQAR